VIGGGPSHFAEQLDVEPPEDGKGDDIEATYDYKDEEGRLLFQVVRFRGKKFRQRRPDGSGGWVWGLKDVRRVLYRLPDLKGKKTVYVVEGEKDADRLWALGIPATTCPMGAGKWQEEYTGQIKDLGVERVVILPDNDPEGRKHAAQVALSCLKAGLEVKVVNLPGLPHKGDVSDWLDNGHVKDDLAEIVSGATPLTTLEGLTGEAEGVEKPLVRLIRASEFEAPPVEWLIDGLVPLGMVTLLSGKDTLGKTLFALEVARSVLTGKPLLGNWTANATGPVVALFLDDARPVTHERLETLGIKAHPSLWVASYDDIDLADPVAMLTVLEAEALQRRAKLIVVDSLWHLIPPRSGAANDQGLMRPLMQALVRMAGQTGAAVLLVAHDRKAGDDVAGSHIIKAASKTILRLTLPKGTQIDPDEMPDTPDRVLRFESNLAYPKTWRLRLEGVGAWSYCGTQREYRGKALEYEVLDYLQGGGEGTADEIREALGKKAADVRAVLKQQAGAGQIQADEQGTKGRPKTIYRALTFRPDEPLCPDTPDEKSQAELIEFDSVTRLEGFSSRNPAPRG